MLIWDHYPADYRQSEVSAILAAIRAGECVAVVGLSGSGKSNLLGFLAHRCSGNPRLSLVDCNRLDDFSTPAFYRLIRQSLGEAEPATDESLALEMALGRSLREQPGLSLLFDRFDILEEKASPTLFSNLRALRDTYKYTLTYVVAARRPPNPRTELAELFFANTVWLSPLSESDAFWTIARYAARRGLNWDRVVSQKLIDISWGYPSLLRSACEAYAAGAELTASSLAQQPAVLQRVREFWADQPDNELLARCGLSGHPLLVAAPARLKIDPAQLTAKEHLLWEYFQKHPGKICEKDDLIRAIWPEDVIYERGIRDDSLAQVIRRLREKIEPQPSNPRYIHTIPGRGYRFTPE